MTGRVELLRGLYGPSAAQHAAGLPDIGEGLLRQLESLSADPTPWSCEAMAANLDGARRAVLRLREALMLDRSPDAA